MLTHETKSKIKISGHLKNFSLWVPLDATDAYSRVLALSFMNKVDYKSKMVNIDFINSHNHETVASRL